MNIIDALRIWNEYTENYIAGRGRGELAAGAIVIYDLLTAYNDLAPDWSEAPDIRIRYYCIDADGQTAWAILKPTLGAAHWDHTFRRAELVDLPLGIDWRLCKWQRPEMPL